MPCTRFESVVGLPSLPPSISPADLNYNRPPGPLFSCHCGFTALFLGAELSLQARPERAHSELPECRLLQQAVPEVDPGLRPGQMALRAEGWKGWLWRRRSAARPQGGGGPVTRGATPLRGHSASARRGVRVPASRDRGPVRGGTSVSVPSASGSPLHAPPAAAGGWRSVVIIGARGICLAFEVVKILPHSKSVLDDSCEAPWGSQTPGLLTALLQCSAKTGAASGGSDKWGLLY